MSKLQLYISKSGREQVRLADINADSVVSGAIKDMRATVANVDYPASDKSVFYIVDNIQAGYCIHIIRTIPPTKPNYLDATIFVGSETDIMAEDLADTIAVVTEKMLASAVTDADMKELEEFFAVDYDNKDKVKRIKPSRGSETAYVACSGRRSFESLISEGLYRPEWSAYKCVVVIGDDFGMMPGTVVDLDEVESEAEKPRRKSKDVAEDKVADEEATLHYGFVLPMTTPDGHTTLEFEVESSKPITRSPISGYEIAGKAKEGEVNRLRRGNDDGIYGKLGRLIWIIAGFVVGVVVMMIASLFDVEDSHAEKASSSASHEKVASTEGVESSEATAYLDNNNIWQREQMERIEGLQGLFDAMNQFRFDELGGKWSKELSGSKNFARVARAAQKARSKKVDPRRDKDHNPCYNREGDTRINWVGYIYWIDP